MFVHQNNDVTSIFDKHFTITCPHCGAKSGISAISIPRWELIKRFRLTDVGLVYSCDACHEPVFLKFQVRNVDENPLWILEEPEEVQRPPETFELNYLPTEVAADFKEALTCYSDICLNAFAAMCRRTVQSACTVLGSAGTSKVQNQLDELKEMDVVDEAAHDQLKQIILSGHDGAHPHLPTLDAKRAEVLLELMKDILYQLFVRQAKIKEAKDMRVKKQQ